MKQLFSVCAAAFLLVSCEGDFDIVYHWENMEAYNADNSYKWPEITTKDSIKSSVFAIKLELEVVETHRDGRYLDPEWPPSNSNPLETLVIKSSADFNPTFPAGSDLVDLFVILNGNYLETLPANGSEGYYITNHTSYEFNEKPWPDDINLLLTEAPTEINYHTFTVIFTLKDGTVFTSTTNPIKIYP